MFLKKKACNENENEKRGREFAKNTRHFCFKKMWVKVELCTHRLATLLQQFIKEIVTTPAKKPARGSRSGSKTLPTTTRSRGEGVFSSPFFLFHPVHVFRGSVLNSNPKGICVDSPASTRHFRCFKFINKKDYQYGSYTNTTKLSKKKYPFFRPY